MPLRSCSRILPATALMLPCGPTRCGTAATFSPAMLPDGCLPRRDAAALKPPRFPILTFDEWQPSLSSGSVFNLKWLMPGESLVSILWKFACADAMPRQVLMHLMKPNVDPYEGLAPARDVIDLMRLCRLLRLPQNVLRGSLLHAALHGRYHSAFRYFSGELAVLLAIFSRAIVGWAIFSHL